jgi:Spy/CpxP family protein refolding chaperone
MKYKNALYGFVLILVLSTSQAISAKSAIASRATSTTIQNPQGVGDQARDDLNLTADQKAQLNSIRESERDQLRAVHNDQSLTQEQKKAKARSIREASHQQLQGILTPQQQQSLKSSRQGRLEHGHGPGGDDALNLTADQKSQIKSIHQSASDQVNAIKNDSTLTPDQKEAKIKSIHQNAMQQVSALLTPEQREKMHDHGRGRRGGEGRPNGRGGRQRDGLLGPPNGRP